MCLGIPMEILEHDGFVAVCARGDERRRVSLALLGEVPKGAHVLVHIDLALRVLEPGEAARIEDALCGLEAIIDGRSPDAFFADLDREPVLPPHLRGGQS